MNFVSKIIDTIRGDTKCELAQRCEHYTDTPACNDDKYPIYCGIYKDVTWKGKEWRLRKDGVQ